MRCREKDKVKIGILLFFSTWFFTPIWYLDCRAYCDIALDLCRERKVPTPYVGNPVTQGGSPNLLFGRKGQRKGPQRRKLPGGVRRFARRIWEDTYALHLRGEEISAVVFIFFRKYLLSSGSIFW